MLSPDNLAIILLILLVLNIALFIFLFLKLKQVSRLFNALKMADVKKISKDLDELKKDNSKAFQKIGIIKFNPFKDMGGTLSFAMALLNKKDEGVIISSLHSRESTRFYVKDIPSGNDKKTKLSFEERKALEKASKS